MPPTTFSKKWRKKEKRTDRVVEEMRRCAPTPAGISSILTMNGNQRQTATDRGLHRAHLHLFFHLHLSITPLFIDLFLSPLLLVFCFFFPSLSYIPHNSEFFKTRLCFFADMTSICQQCSHGKLTFKLPQSEFTSTIQSSFIFKLKVCHRNVANSATDATRIHPDGPRDGWRDGSRTQNIYMMDSTVSGFLKPRISTFKQKRKPGIFFPSFHQQLIPLVSLILCWKF